MSKRNEKMAVIHVCNRCNSVVLLKVIEKQSGVGSSTSLGESIKGVEELKI